MPLLALFATFFLAAHCFLYYLFLLGRHTTFLTTIMISTIAEWVHDWQRCLVNCSKKYGILPDAQHAAERMPFW